VKRRAFYKIMGLVGLLILLSLALTTGSPNARTPVTGRLGTDVIALESAPGGSVTRRMGAVKRFVPGRILVKFRPGVSASAALARHSLQELRYIAGLDVHVLAVPPGQELSTVARLQADPAVEYAEPDYIAHALRTPNDPYYSYYQWNLRQINLPAAWDISTGSADVVIAVLDTGLDMEHPDLAGKIWVNADEIPGNGWDDDGNNRVDDVNGWDFVNNDNDPQDDEGHGTHVAGIAAAATDNNTGVASVSWGSVIMPLKVLNTKGEGSYSIIAEAVYYAANNGAHIINLSLGGEGGDNTLRDAINYAYGKGCLIVAAAGNCGDDSASYPTEYCSQLDPVFYPAAYEHVVGVGATGDQDEQATYSNSGNYIDVVAPGGNPTSGWDPDPNHWIMSTYWRGAGYGDYVQVAGTSQAAPHVAGLAALLWSVDPSLTNDRVEQIIESTAVDLGDPGRDDQFGYGRIDALAALQAIATLTVTAVSPSEVTNDAPITVSITGNGFHTGATAMLTRTAVLSIPAQTVSGVSSTTITCTFDISGAATGYWNVSVANPDGTTATLPDGFFIYEPGHHPPVVSGISPAQGVVSQVLGITIEGAYFTRVVSGSITVVPTVTLLQADERIYGSHVTYLSTSTLTCTLDLTAAPTGTWDVMVTNPDGLTGTLPAAFLVQPPSPPAPPTVTTIYPDRGTVGQVLDVTITGTNFLTRVLNGSTTILPTVTLLQADERIYGSHVTYLSTSTLTCTLDLTAAPTGTWDVMVTNPDGLTGTLPAAFLVQTPAYTAYLPLVLRNYPPLPEAPVLETIDNLDGDDTYTITWSTARLADSYLLQEDTDSAFPHPTDVYFGPETTYTVTEHQGGIYYYRVRGHNDWGHGPWSNIQEVEVRYKVFADQTSDGCIASELPTYTFNISPTMQVGYHWKTGIWRSYLFFDLSFIPSGSTVDGAAITIYLVGYEYALGTDPDMTVTVRRIPSPWPENPTWENFSGNWAESYYSVVVGSPPPEALPEAHYLDVSALVRAWVDSAYPNYGVMLHGQENPPHNIKMFAAAEYGLPYAPTLTVYYTAPDGQAYVAIVRANLGGESPGSRAATISVIR